MNAISVGLDMFKNEHESAFARTNGYPPSYVHPRMVDAGGSDIFDRDTSEFPFLEEKPQVYGAHWLPMMLMGVDGLGYITRKTVPRANDLRDKPWLWYTADPFNDDGRQLDRSPLYLDATKVPTLPTRDLPGIPPNRRTFFKDWGDPTASPPDGMHMLPVLVDAWDQPILYYAANRNGRDSNMVEKNRNENNTYNNGIQQNGPPYYFHEDNEGFTGTSYTDPDFKGWDLRGGAHAIAESGHDLTASEIAAGLDVAVPEKYYNFARFLLDPKTRRALEAEGEEANELTPLKPVNPDTFLLLSPGVDARWGTPDDVTNFSIE